MKILKVVLESVGKFRGVYFLSFSDWRHFLWSKGGVQNHYREEGGEGEDEGGKRFLNCQIILGQGSGDKFYLENLSAVIFAS